MRRNHLEGRGRRQFSGNKCFHLAASTPKMEVIKNQETVKQNFSHKIRNKLKKLERKFVQCNLQLFSWENCSAKLLKE